MAANLQACFGLDVLDPPSGRGTMAKCAAAQGNNCQDDYTKLHPVRMFMDDVNFELLAAILLAAMAAVDASRPGAPRLDPRRGERPGELVTGEAQILRFISGKTDRARGSRMHVLFLCGYSADGSRRRRGCDVEIRRRGQRRRGCDVDILWR